MHILLIHQVFVRPQDPGGTRHYEFARYLADAGHRVTILAGAVSYLTGEQIDDSPDSQLGDGIRVIRCAVLGDVHRSFVWRTLGFVSFMISAFGVGLQVPKVDLIWGTSPPLFQGCSAWALARLKRVPWVFEVRDLWPAFAVQVGVLRNPLLVKISQRVECFLYRNADRIVANSPGFVQHISRVVGDGTEVTVIPNGVDPNEFKPDESGSEVRREFGWDDRFVALYAGAHGLSNDLDVLLAAAEILRENQNVLFVFLGDGKEKSRLAESARSKGLENVHFLPPVPKTDVSTVFTGIDCGIAILKPIPLYETTYPNKVFDYMAAGKPVVLAIGGVIQEVIEKANAGIPVPPGDPQALSEAILALAAQPDQARRMGADGRIYVEAHFDRTQIAADLLSLFQDITGGRIQSKQNG
jgi:glycosyltransferase involved in cell wall biosynthesis